MKSCGALVLCLTLFLSSPSSSSSSILQGVSTSKLQNRDTPSLNRALIRTIHPRVSPHKRRIYTLVNLNGGGNAKRNQYDRDPLYEDRLRGELYEEVRYDQNRYKRLTLRVFKHILRFALHMLPLMLPANMISFGSATKLSKDTEFAIKMAVLTSIYDSFWSSSSSLYVYICLSSLFSLLSLIGVQKLPLLPVHTSAVFTVTHLVSLMIMLFVRYSLHEKDAAYQFSKNLKNNYL